MKVESAAEEFRGYPREVRGRKVERLKRVWAQVGLQEVRLLGRRVQVYVALVAQSKMEGSETIQPWAAWRQAIGIGHSEFRRALKDLVERGVITRTTQGRHTGTVTLLCCHRKCD